MPKTSDNTRFMLRVVTLGWAGLTLLQFTIWAMISIISGEVDRPWWLWFSVPSGIVVAGLWWWFKERRDSWESES